MTVVFVSLIWVEVLLFGCGFALHWLLTTTSSPSGWRALLNAALCGLTFALLPFVLLLVVACAGGELCRRNADALKGT